VATRAAHVHCPPNLPLEHRGPRLELESCQKYLQYNKMIKRKRWLIDIIIIISIIIIIIKPSNFILYVTEPILCVDFNNLTRKCSSNYNFGHLI